MSLKKMMIIDISIFTVLGILLDSFLGLTNIFYIKFLMTLSYSLIVLVYYRWGYYGIVINVAIIVTHFLVYFKTDDIVSLIFHSVSLLSFLLIPSFKKLINNNLGKKSLLNVIILIVPVFIIAISVEYLLGLSFVGASSLVSYLIYHSLNLLLNILILIIISKQENLLVDMKEYLIKESKGKESGGRIQKSSKY
ncbi:MAG: hypothetical protein LBV58_02505 [Acholeplasmatales bacterium]|jgi:ABC-type multidrug transport system fused ATPase/permease subunit|nr:hypothetical protein [Acholeplasmatales bacterium]